MTLPARLHVQRVNNGVVVAGPSGDIPRQIFVYTDGETFGREMTRWFDAFLGVPRPADSSSDVTLIATDMVQSESGVAAWSEDDDE